MSAEPFLRWVGGKRQLVDELTSHFDIPLKGAYYEPFVGGGALFFHLKAMHGALGLKASINDANPDLVNVYVQVRDNVEAVIEELKQLDVDAGENGMKAVYLLVRDLFNTVTKKGTPLHAADFIALNAWGFNGLCRYNRKGQFNVPCGKFAKTPVLMDKAENLRAASQALKGVTITCGDFAAAVGDAKRGDLVYFDPPYIPASATSDFTSYTSDGFGAAEQRCLAGVAAALVARGVHVILSNSDTPATRKLYSAHPCWALHEVQARRAVNCKASKRGKVGELIIVGRP